MACMRPAVYLAVIVVLLTSATGAGAHGMIGQRFFPATLAIDDPFVADELSLPTVSFMPFGRRRTAPRFARRTSAGSSPSA